MSFETDFGGMQGVMPAVVVLAAMFGCARNPESSADGTVTGTVAYRRTDGPTA